MALSRYGWLVALTFIVIAFAVPGQAASRWGASYFPNVPLTTHDGEQVHFFDDLIKDKIVVINFIYTSCPDTCPLETAQLTRVQNILGDRLGRDVFFYSITIDPANDTVDALRSYRGKFGARWTFLTGDKQDIISLRRKLGLYIEDIGGGINNHNVNMIIGNQATGRWMKRSPYENPYVLADQIGNWLSGWKAPQQVKDFANAPKLRAISDGEKLFRTRCEGCHTIDGSPDSIIGPDLLGVTKRRDRSWLENWLRAPDRMLAQKDPIAIELYQRFNQVAMPNMRLSNVDVADLLHYLGSKKHMPTVAGVITDSDPPDEPGKTPSTPRNDVVAVMNAWIREAISGSTINAGYMTLVNPSPNKLTLVDIQSDAFSIIRMHEMKMVNRLIEMHDLKEISIPSGGQVQFTPGGLHLMLERPSMPVTLGRTIELTLYFQSGEQQMISLPVVNR